MLLEYVPASEMIRFWKKRGYIKVSGEAGSRKERRSEHDENLVNQSSCLVVECSERGRLPAERMVLVRGRSEWKRLCTEPCVESSERGWLPAGRCS